jgi:signal transduction histidine kinase
MHDPAEMYVRVGSLRPRKRQPTPSGNLVTAARTVAVKARPARLPFAEDSPLLDIKIRPVMETPLVPEPHWASPPTGDMGRKRAGFVDRVVLDITRQHELRQAQLRAQELAVANRRKDEFLAILAHELRSPLSSMRYALCLLSRQTDQVDAKRRTQQLLERQLARMTQLVDGLLDVSRITNGRMHLQRVTTDLRVIVTNSIETLQPVLNEREQRLSIEFPTAPLWVQADSCRLEQVFVNLLANASRYTDAGGELRVRMHESDGHAVVRIRDSGIGIAADALVHIFELFAQANSDTRSQAGLGVGLAVVRELVQLHEGRVTAASPGVGLGTEFTVHLPSFAPVGNVSSA